MKKIDLKGISTEQSNPRSYNIDRVSTIEMVKIINSEDSSIADSIAKVSNVIAECIDLIQERFEKGGRLIYIGAGTSGRLGVLDASEILPTYGVKDRIVGLIAGGDDALRNPIEKSEDNEEQVVLDLKHINFSNKDVLMGIAASGRTPYVISGLKYANEIGALSLGLCMSENSAISNVAIKTISVLSGPEVVTGSTRMKAGTATKMVLNMISTILMIKFGKVYHNLMIDVKATNEKLQNRCFNIVKNLTPNANDELIWKLLKEADFSCPLVILMISKEINLNQAKELLEKNHNRLAGLI